MPFGKAGGVTWGGKVHETGKFGIVRFAKPTDEQREAMERRIVRHGWLKFRVDSKELEEYWSDKRIGDPVFFETQFQPALQRISALAPADPALRSLSPKEISQGMTMLDDLLELPFLASSLRGEFLLNKHFEEQP